MFCIFLRSPSFDGVIGWSGHKGFGHGILQSKLTSWSLPFCLFFTISSVKCSSNFFARISAFASIAIGDLNHTTSISLYIQRQKNLLNFKKSFLRPCLQSILFFKNVFQSPVKCPRLRIIIFSAAETEIRILY